MTGKHVKRTAKSITQSQKGTRVTTENENWGLNYPDLAQLSLDAATAFYLGDSPLPPSMDMMLEQNPLWLQDVFQNVALLKFQLDTLGDD